VALTVVVTNNKFTPPTTPFVVPINSFGDFRFPRISTYGCDDVRNERHCNHD
jgi:hypothetical protein